MPPWFLRRMDVVLVGVAIGFAAMVHWRSLAVTPLAIDEHVSFWIADGSSPGTLLGRSYSYSATPPLSFLLQRASISLFGPVEWSLRLPAAVSFFLTLVAVWWVGRRRMSPWAGAMAAGVFAIFPAIHEIAVAGRPYSVGLLLAALAIEATARTVERPTSMHWAALAIVNLLLVQTHYLFASIWILEFVWIARAMLAGSLPTRHLFIWLAPLLLAVGSVAPGLVRVWQLRLYLNWTDRADWDSLAMVLAPIRPDWQLISLATFAAGVPIAWQSAAGRVRPREWWDPKRLVAGRSFVMASAFGSFLAVASLWLLGRFWLASLAADRYLLVFVPIIALAWGWLCSSFRGVVAPLLSLSVLIWWSGAPARIHRELSRLTRRQETSVTAQDPSSSWKQAADLIAGQTPQPGLILVSSGLTEMKLIPVFLGDLEFHDYVSCRMGRMYLPGDTRRLSIPMFWPRGMSAALERFYRSEIARTCRAGATPGATPGPIWLVVATDTDVLEVAARDIRQLVESAGAVQTAQWELEGVWVMKYCCP